MRTLQLAVAGLGLLVLGCRSDNSSVLLERDLRMQEDKIYQLQSCLEDAQAAREATIHENETLKQELTEATRSPGQGSRPGSDYQAPSVELPSGGAPSRSREAPQLEPPTIELPESGPTQPAETAPSDKESAAIESPPTQLVINKRLTGGLDRDGHDGDDGILVVFEPRDAAGHLVKWPGKVSVVAMDPALEGPAARVARWDFSSEEVPAHYLNTVFGRGLQFELPWTSNPPAHRELVLFVRFTTDDGQKLTADTKIEVRPPGDAAAVDRQTNRSSPGGEGGPSAKREPRSRLKARTDSGDAPRATRAPGATDSAHSESPGDADADVAAESDPREEVPLEAARPQRPKWKPFR